MKLLFRERDAQAFGGSCIFEWRPGGNQIAVGGVNGHLRIYSRYGDVVEEFSINESISTLNWDSEGELLAITNHRSSTIIVYEQSTSNVQTIDISIGSKNTPTFVCWSPVEPTLLIGDSRGTVTIYNHRTSRKTPLAGRHNRSIQTGAFNDDGSLYVLGSEDGTITVNNSDGDTINTFSFGDDVRCIRVTKIRRLDDADGADRPEDYMSVIINGRTLMIIKLSQPDNPVHLQFMEKYGDIVTTAWYGNGNVAVGFERGHVVAIAAESSAEISQELFSVQDFRGRLADLTVNTDFSKLFIIGDNLLKSRELYDLKELVDMIDVDSDQTGLCAVRCCEDGSLTAVSSRGGTLSVYLTRQPILAAAYKSCVGVLSSLTEITVYRDVETQPYHTLSLGFEPSLIVVGPNHIAAVLNHTAWFYQVRRNGSTLVYQHDYMSTVTKLRMNGEFAIALVDGKVQLHRIPPSPSIDGLTSPAAAAAARKFDAVDSSVFPDDGNAANGSADDNIETILDAELSERFFVYSTTSHRIHYYSLASQRPVTDYRHVCAVRRLYAETDGIRLCFIDERRDAYVYGPVDETLTRIPSVSPLLHYEGCLWETFTVDRDTIVVYDKTSMYVFAIGLDSKKEQILNQLATVPIPYGNHPLVLSKGIVSCNTDNGRVNTILLKSHRTDSIFEGKARPELFELLHQSLALKRWRNAWRLCDHINDPAAWQPFGRAALEDTNVDLAIRVFRLVGDVAMVWALEELRHIENRDALAGHVAALLGRFDEADELFGRAGQPLLALSMRRDVQHWDRALELAEQFAPAELPAIAREYAVQLELLGKHRDALAHYERALAAFGSACADPDAEDDETAENAALCRGGVARMALRVGDIQRGVQAAMAMSDRAIKRDCGLILEQIKQYEEAGRLYECGQFYERAVVSFLRCKNWLKVHDLISHVRSPKILGQYARILMSEKKYEQAFELFHKALDYDNMIGLLLKQLNRPEEAIRLAQESRSIEGAKMVAKFFTDLNNNESAIEFLVLSQCFQEAYELAVSRNCMQIYADAIEAGGHSSHFPQLADFFGADDHYDALMAGKFAGLSGNYDTALDHLIKASSGQLVGGDDPAVEYAVEFAAASGDQPSIYRLIEHLMGETDGIPKDPKYLFQLYVRLKMFAEAAKTAVIIAQDQQSKGFYKAAHDLLLDMYSTLREQKIRVPTEMESSLQILHSYNIVKSLVKRGENETAARLLMRVVANIGQFQAHSTQILTSAVVTCTKAGLRAPAFKYASLLMQPAHRQKIDEKYRKKIETIVRKSERDIKDPHDERLTPCPFCSALVAEYTLTCDQCKSSLPYCIITGRHVVADDFTTCPSCSFPASYSEFTSLLRHDGEASNCPMCHKKVVGVQPKQFDAKAYFT